MNISEFAKHQEQDHYMVLDNICTFVARPQTSLENAELYRMNDSVGGAF